MGKCFGGVGGTEPVTAFEKLKASVLLSEGQT